MDELNSLVEAHPIAKICGQPLHEVPHDLYIPPEALEIFLDTFEGPLDLLLYLIGNENRVLSKSAIAEHLSGDMADMLDNHDFVYAHIKNLKKKLNEAGSGDYIKSVYGLGYKWKNE